MADDAPSPGWSLEQVHDWLRRHARLLLDDRLRDPLSGTSVLNGIAVSLTRCA